MSHPLDNVCWSAFSGPHQIGFTEGTNDARWLLSDFGPFGAVADTNSPKWEPFLRINNPELIVALFSDHFFEPPAPLEVVIRAEAIQFISPGILPEPQAGLGIVKLSADDAAEMRALALETKPGPFLPRTHELGTFFGIRVDGVLVAMAGERMRPAGFTEISAVCTRDAFRGRGYAAALVLTVAQNVRVRGDVPFLHVAAENTKAIELYIRLGFIERMKVKITVFRNTKPPSE